MLASVLVAVLAAAPAPAPANVYDDLAVELLRQYLRIDTTVPPGNEIKAAQFFKSVLEKEGIAADIDEYSPGRANVIAVLKGSGAKRPLILSNHMDVVPADPKRWTVAPFEGVSKDGFIYGRGAEDMKGEGILQLLAFIRAKREGLALDRDLVFMGTADEEEDFGGALRAVDEKGFLNRIKNAEFLLTEGSENIVDAAGKPQYFGVDTAEKGPFWLTLRTTGTPGHGSRPIQDSALNRLVRALERVRLHKTEMKVLPVVDKFFRDQAAQAGERATWYRDVKTALADPKAKETLYGDRDVSSLLRNSISITVARAGYKTNVIPGTAEAELDVRLLPEEDPQAFLAEMKRVIDDPTVEIVPPATFRPPNSSPVDSEVFRAIERVLARTHPGVLVTTKMLTGATECVVYRPLGIGCYGFAPLLTTREEQATTHGDDERVHEGRFRAAVAPMYEIVRELAGPATPAAKKRR